MCVWCERYGEGYERWYLNPANYARRLYKVRKDEPEAAGAEGNPQAAGGMAGFRAAAEKTGDSLRMELEKTLPQDSVCEFAFFCT